MSQNSQKLTVSLTHELKDCFGVIEVGVKINGKEYIYPISSEFALRKVKRLLKCKHPKYRKVLNVLKTFKISGFNSFEKGEVNDKDTY
jgi:hypothetical protein